MKNRSVKIDCKLKLNASPHFIIEGRWRYDSADEDHVYMLEKEGCAKIRWHFENLYMNDALEHDLKTEISSEAHPYDIMRKGLFQALKKYLPLFYENMENYSHKDEVSKRYLVDTIGFCNHHTFQKITHSDWMYENTTEDLEIEIIENGKPVYKPNETELFAAKSDLFEDIKTFADFIESVKMLPDKSNF